MVKTFIVNEPMAIRHKHKTAFYHGDGEGEEAKRLATMERGANRVGLVRDASAFNGEIENVNKVVILPGVRSQHRKMIEGCYGGDLIKVRGSDKWLGGEIRSIGPHGVDAAVIIPEGLTVSGPKGNPEEVNPETANPTAALPHHVVERQEEVRRRPGRPRKQIYSDISKNLAEKPFITTRKEPSQ